MKAKLIIIFVVFFASAYSQTFWFDQSECLGSVAPVYTYNNYQVGTHGHGYDVFRNGVLIRSNSSAWGGYYCQGLRFVNDSVGFLIEGNSGFGIYRTADYGATWVGVGGGPPYLLGLYVVNENTAYYFSDYNGIWISRCSDLLFRTNPVLTSSLTKDSTVLDTIAGSPLCINQTHITGSITNSNGDTINFTVMFQISPVGIQTSAQNVSTLSIFPNPSTGIIKLQSSTELGLLTIHNSIGEMIARTEVHHRLFEIDIRDQPPGIYILQAQGKHYRFVKE